jgi:hypothetical protein
MPDTGHDQHEKFIYFVDNVKYESEQSPLTGAQIKAAIPNFDRTYSLFLEEPGDEPDKLINDNDSVSLEKEHGPRRLYTVPPATFGQK